MISSTILITIVLGAIITSAWLLKKNGKLRFYVKFSFYYISVTVISMMMIPIFAFRPRDPINFTIAAEFFKPVTYLLGLKCVIEGKEYLTGTEPCIVVANHQSFLDILGMFPCFTLLRRCSVIAKKITLYSGPFGIGGWLGGLIYVDRAYSPHTKAVLAETLERVKRKKIKLWFYAEGTRRNTGEIHPFRKGAFHVAITAKLPIVPIVYRRLYFVDVEKRRFDSGIMYMKALPPISTEKFTIDDVQELTETVRSVMIKTFNELNKTVP